MARHQYIAITTDLGTNDHFVGVMKGVMLGIYPEAKVVDVNLQVNPFDIFDGAFNVLQAARFFPPDTIHLVVVDPGVGSERRPIVARAFNQRFVAPDNGVLSFLYEKEPTTEVVHVTADHYFLNPVSNTFHGRDVFAPLAAWLARGVEVTRLGDQITDFVRFATPQPKAEGANTWKGAVLKVDRFGNLITNFTPGLAPQLFSANSPPFRLTVGQKIINQFRPNYAQGQPDELFALVGSSDYLEIATNRGSAARLLNAARGAEVTLQLGAQPAGT
ncbi:MAG: SAM-dependent chlorinase/fluorinase [Acidobacteria bacterium]|nr:SAM-dependent chlorinase/fluorinase [Acidobacteriota bacterium]